MQTTKLVLSGLIALMGATTAQAADCPKISGDYSYTVTVADVRVDVDVRVDQVRCEVLIVRTRTDNTDRTETYPVDGVLRGSLTSATSMRAEKNAFVQTEVQFGLTTGLRSTITQYAKGRNGDLVVTETRYDGSGRVLNTQTTTLTRSR